MWICVVRPGLIIYHKEAVLCSPSSELFKHWSGQLINDFMKRMPTGHGVEPVWVVTHCPGMYSWILLPVITWFSLYLLCQLPASTAACILAEILAFTKRERFSLTSLSGQSLKHLQLAALAARRAASQRGLLNARERKSLSICVLSRL